MMLAYPAGSCGDRGRIPSGGAIMSGSFLAGKPRCAESGFNAREIVFKKRASFRGDRIAPGRRVAKGGFRVHHRVPGAFGTVISRPHAPASRADELEQGAGFADACPATQAWGEDDFRPANLTGPDFGLHAGFSFSDPGIPARPVPHGRFPAGHPHGSPRFPLVQTALAFFSLPGFLPS